MSVSNCVLFALRLYWRRARRGVPQRHRYLVWRASWTPVGHVLYAERRRNGTLRVVHYCPVDKRPLRVPPPWFEGASRWGDL